MIRTGWPRCCWLTMACRMRSCPGEGRMGTDVRASVSAKQGVLTKAGVECQHGLVPKHAGIDRFRLIDGIFLERLSGAHHTSQPVWKMWARGRAGLSGLRGWLRTEGGVEFGPRPTKASYLYWSVTFNLTTYGDHFEIGCCPLHVFSLGCLVTVNLVGVVLVPPGVVTVIGPLVAP